MQTARGTPLRRRGHLVVPTPHTEQHETGRAGRVAVDSPPGRPLRRRVSTLIWVALVVFVLDVTTKLVVVATLSDHAPIRLLGGAVVLEVTRNGGAAFSIGTGATVIFAVVAIAVIVVILRSARRLYSTGWAVVLGLLLGGATGNLLDRLARSPGVLRGRVVDWIRVPHFAVFNLADSAITIGGVLAVLLALVGRQMDGTIVRSPRHSATDRSEPDPDDAES